ncbi:MAG: hypothetical protein WCR67_01265, partial [Bacilli bacterium]
RFFELFNTKTGTDGSVTSVYKLKGSYLDSYGRYLVATIGENQAIDMDSMSLTVKNDKITKLSYSYVYFANSKKVGEMEGTINYTFDDAEVIIPSFKEENYLDQLFVPSMEKYSDSEINYAYHTKISSFLDKANGEGYYISEEKKDFASSSEDYYYYDSEGNIHATFTENNQEYDFKVMNRTKPDMSCLERDSFYIDQSGAYVLKKEDYNKVFAGLLSLQGNDYSFIGFKMVIYSDAIEIIYSYNYRILLDDGSYAVFYIENTLLVSDQVLAF